MNRKALVIDDESVVGTVISRALEPGYTSDCCLDAASGLDCVSRQSYELIFLDIKLADRDGLEVFHDIRRVSPSSKVVLITGYLDLSVHQEVEKLRPDGFLTKPFHVDDLLHVVERLSLA
ncbi:MAG: response regulator [Candidatus Eremiobacterota bacterium]